MKHLNTQEERENKKKINGTVKTVKTYIKGRQKQERNESEDKEMNIEWNMKN